MANIADNDRPASPSGTSRPSREEAEQAVRTLIAWAGDDPDREGMRDTPARVTASYGELFAGYAQDPERILGTIFADISGYDDMVLVRDIPLFTHCEHHMVPFFGTVHIAYLPRSGVVGLSKLVRLTEAFARRFQTQENLTAQILNAIDTHLEPAGAAIQIEAEHMCMSMRGVRTPGTTTITQKFSGCFNNQPELQGRFLSMIS